jgi:hypothetical protein
VASQKDMIMTAMYQTEDNKVTSSRREEIKLMCALHHNIWEVKVNVSLCLTN